MSAAEQSVADAAYDHILGGGTLDPARRCRHDGGRHAVTISSRLGASHMAQANRQRPGQQRAGDGEDRAAGVQDMRSHQLRLLDHWIIASKNDE